MATRTQKLAENATTFLSSLGLTKFSIEKVSARKITAKASELKVLHSNLRAAGFKEIRRTEGKPGYYTSEFRHPSIYGSVFFPSFEPRGTVVIEQSECPFQVVPISESTMAELKIACSYEGIDETRGRAVKAYFAEDHENDANRKALEAFAKSRGFSHIVIDPKNRVLSRFELVPVDVCKFTSQA